MNPRVRLVALILVLVGAVAGCGVPTSGRPVVVRAAAQKDATSDQAPITKDPPSRTIDAQELVRRYLMAMAWGNQTGIDPTAMDTAVSFAKGFLTPDARNSWQRGQDIIVERTTLGLPVITATSIQVEVAMQQVGVLDNQGIITPRPGSAPHNYQFTVVPAGDGGGLRIANPPPGMLLSVEALTSLYQLWPIYFWDASGRNLVPDLRYVSKAQTVANRDLELSGWLLRGPSEYLGQAVIPVNQSAPAQIELKDRPVRDGTHLRVNLSNKAANVQAQLPKFVVQLRWTLRWLAGTVDLQLEGQRQNISTGDVLRYNLAVAPDGQRDPPRLGVVNGRVSQIGGDPVPLSILSNDANAGVVSAAVIHGAAEQVGLVREDAPGKVRLWLGAEKQNTAQYTGTDLVASSMSRPVGLAGPGARVLIAADGRLYDVPFEGRQATDVTPSGIGAVTGVSVAADGRRMALVAGGRAYVGVLQAPADASPVTLAQPQELSTGLSDVTGVAWSREERIVVAGRSAGQSALVETTIDGALVDPLQLRNLPGPTVGRVVASPVVNPGEAESGRGLIMLEANGRTYNVFSESVVELNPDPAYLTAPPKPGKPATLTSPFFLD